MLRRGCEDPSACGVASAIIQLLRPLKQFREALREKQEKSIEGALLSSILQNLDARADYDPTQDIEQLIVSVPAMVPALAGESPDFFLCLREVLKLLPDRIQRLFAFVVGDERSTHEETLYILTNKTSEQFTGLTRCSTLLYGSDEYWVQWKNWIFCKGKVGLPTTSLVQRAALFTVDGAVILPHVGTLDSLPQPLLSNATDFKCTAEDRLSLYFGLGFGEKKFPFKVIDGHPFLEDSVASLVAKGSIGFFVRKLLYRLSKITNNQTIDGILQNILFCEEDQMPAFCEANISETMNPTHQEEWIQLFCQKTNFCNIRFDDKVKAAEVPFQNTVSTHTKTVCDVIVFSEEKCVIVNLTRSSDRKGILESLEEVVETDFSTVKLHVKVEGDISFGFTLHPFRFSPVCAVTDTIRYELLAFGVKFKDLSIHFQTGEEVPTQQGDRTTYLADFFASRGKRDKLHWQIRLIDGEFPPSEPILRKKPRIIQLSKSSIFEKQQMVGKELADRVMEILGADADNFIGINYIVSVPPLTTLQAQTKERLGQAGLSYDQSREYVMQLYSRESEGKEVMNVHSLERESFFQSVQANKKILHFIIADECHWGISKNGAHAKLINSQNCENLFVLLVSATPFNVLSKTSRVHNDELHIVDWFSTAITSPPTTKTADVAPGWEYCRLSDYVANMGEAIRQDTRFENLLASIADKGTHEVSRTQLLLVEYIISFCWYSVQFDYDDFCLRDIKGDRIKQAKNQMESLERKLTAQFGDTNSLVLALHERKVVQTNWTGIFKQKKTTKSETDKVVESLLRSLKPTYFEDIKADELFSRKVLSKIRMNGRLAVLFGDLHVVRLERGEFGDESQCLEAFKAAIRECRFSFLPIMHTMSGTPLSKGIDPSFRKAAQYKGKDWNPAKPVVFEDLEGLPGLMLVVDKARMGDTFPKNFTHLDLRARDPAKPNLSSLIQSLGRLCTYTEGKALLRKALVSETTWKILKGKREILVDIYLKGKVPWDTTLKGVDPFNKEAKSDSYDCNNKGKHNKRLVLCAEPQVGKTGTYISFLHEMRQRIGELYAPGPKRGQCFPEDEWNYPNLEALERQKFLKYGDVNFSEKYTFRVQVDRLMLLIQALQQSPGDWHKVFINLVYQEEAIFSENGRKSLASLLELPADPPLGIQQDSFKVLKEESLVQCLTWDKRGGGALTDGIWTQWTEDLIPLSSLEKQGVSQIWKNPENHEKRKTRQKYQFFRSADANLPSEDIEELLFDIPTGDVTFEHTEHGRNHIRFAVPPGFKKFFRLTDGKLLGLPKKNQHSWFFCPTARNPDQTSLSLTKTMRGLEDEVYPHLVVVVVQPKDYAKWRNSGFVVMETAHTVTLPCPRDPGQRFRKSADDGGCGFSRLAIQVVSAALGLDWSWQMDDNLDRFEHLAYDKEEPAPCFLRQPISWAEKFVKESTRWQTSGNPNQKYACIGFCRGLSQYKHIYQPFSLTHRMYAFYFINNRLTVEKKLFWPPKKVAEDIEFHHVCNEAKLLSVRCNSYFFCKAYLDKHPPTLIGTHKLYRWDSSTNLLFTEGSQPPEAKKATLLKWIQMKLGNLHVTIQCNTMLPLDLASTNITLAIPPTAEGLSLASSSALVVFHDTTLVDEVWKGLHAKYQKLEKVVLLVPSGFLKSKDLRSVSAIKDWVADLDTEVDSKVKVLEVVSNLAPSESGYCHHKDQVVAIFTTRVPSQSAPTGKVRGPYKCSKCGKPKRGHTCSKK